MSYPTVEFVHKNNKIFRIKASHLEADYEFDLKEIKNMVLFYIEENLQWKKKWDNSRDRN